MSSIYYVGIDPSTKTGIVVLDEKHSVVLAEEIQLKDGMYSTIYQILDYGQQIADLVPQHSYVAIEGFALMAKGKSVSLLYGIGYAIRFNLIKKQNYFECPPTTLKKFVTGKGNAKKENMIKDVYKRWSFEHESNNVIDAYALARYAIHARELIT